MKMKSILISALIIVAAAGILYTQEEKIRIAMAPFDDSVTSDGSSERAGATAGGSIRNSFLAVDRFLVREPDAVKEYINKLVEVQTGLANPDSLKGQSGNLKVKYLTVGTVSKFEGIYDIDTRTVNIDTWVIVHSHGSTAGNITEAVSDIDWSIKNQFTREYLKNRNEDDFERPVLTVTNFSDFNIPAQKKGYSGAFSEILNSQLGSFTLISTVERKYARALFEEKILEMAGIVSNDDSGPNLKIKGIQNKLTGDIRVFSDLICINYRLHNTSDGRLVFMGSKEIGSRNGLRSAAWSISNEIEDVLKNRIGSFKITSKPASAEVYIDGKLVGKTPMVTSIASGDHLLKVKLDGYEFHEEKVTITSKQVTEKNITLKAAGLKLMKGIEKKEDKKEETALKIGSRGPSGGWIFYDKGSYSDGWRYLEAAPDDQSESAEWGCYGTSISGAKGTAIGTGKSNTQAIVNGCAEANIAAKLCAAYRGGGKSDWFLPSKDELNLMYTNLKINGVGGFAGDNYWSSSERNEYYAWYQNFGIGSQYAKYNKDYKARVLAARAF